MNNLSLKRPKLGKYILDSISMGMYNNPLMVIREYIQNSVDSIDALIQEEPNSSDNTKIEINIDGRNRNIVIKDNGIGISVKKAWDSIVNIGESTKNALLYRGFRGIGRLSGLGYCDRLQFIMKAKGEIEHTIISWDSKKLDSLIKESDIKLNAVQIIEDVIDFTQQRYKGSKKDHFFIVKMFNVKSSRDILLDVPEVKIYFSQVAPVPFDQERFSFSKKIEKELKRHIQSYNTYNILINGEKIYKPYQDIIKINSKAKDKIEDIKFFEFKNDDYLLAFGWIANLQYLGAISNKNQSGGIRLRSGNILVGDKNLLAGFYREKRFNNYIVGEIHIVDGKLVLNSRRDDFEDNEYKEKFYNCFIKEIGLPLSKKIREASQLRSIQKYHIKNNSIIESAKKIVDSGFLSQIQKNKIINELNQMREDKIIKTEGENIDLLIKNVIETKHVLDNKNIKIKNKEKLQSIFDTIYSACANRKEAEKIINEIIKRNC